MNAIELDALQCAPNTLTKVEVAKWIKAKHVSLSWDECHYHAMRVQMAKLDSYYACDFASIGLDCDLDKIAKIFHDSLSEKYDDVVHNIDVPRSSIGFLDLLNFNLCQS